MVGLPVAAQFSAQMEIRQNGNTQSWPVGVDSHAEARGESSGTAAKPAESWLRR